MATNNPLRQLKHGAARKHGLRNSVIEEAVVIEGVLSKRSRIFDLCRTILTETRLYRIAHGLSLPTP